MIVQFTMNNFMSIGSEQTLSFLATKDKTNESTYVTKMPDGTHLLIFAVLFGANGTGKTNILDAMTLFRRMMVSPPDPNEKWPERSVFIFNPISKDLATSMTLEFYVGGLRHKLAISFDNDIIFSERLSVFYSSRETEIYNRRYKSFHGRSDIDFNEKRVKLTTREKNRIVDNTINNCTVLSAFAKSNVKEDCLQAVHDYFKYGFAGKYTFTDSIVDYARELVSKPDNKEEKKFLVDWLNNGGFSDIKDIYVNESEKDKNLVFDYVLEGRHFEIPEKSESRGIRRYLGLGALLHDHRSTPCLLMVDHLDACLHPRLRRQFIRRFLDSTNPESQLIITSHAYYSLDKDFIRRDTVWFTDKADSRETLLIRLSDCKIHKTTSAHNSYKKGLIVCLPQIGNHIIYLPECIVGIEDDDAVDF